MAPEPYRKEVQLSEVPVDAPLAGRLVKHARFPGSSLWSKGILW